ncbi:MAG: hypothetical protein GXY68_10020 [Chloroflexi bacterium]|mgnify:CR=1 FL=1|jgi:hypothetical protein|nr:hypothetical protein [Chloroflexota bacterium]
MVRRRWLIPLAAALALWLVALPVLAQEAGTALLGQHVTLEAGEVQHGDLVLFGGDLTMLPGSRIEGDLAILGGNASVAGEVSGAVSVIGGTLSLEAGALVHGDVVVAGTLRYRHPQALVRGQLLEGIDTAAGLERVPDLMPRWLARNWGAGAQQGFEAPPRDVSRALGGLGGLILGAIVAAAGLAVVPDNITNVRRVMQSSAGLSIGVGLLTLVVAAVLIPLLVMICIGIPVAAVLGLGVIVCVLLGWVAAGYWLGEKLLAWLKVSASMVVQGAVGVLLLGLASSIPCIGAFMALILACWGLGAVVLTRFGTRLDPIWRLATAPTTATASPTRPEPPTAPVESQPDQDRAGTRPLDERALSDLERDAHDELSTL